MAHAASNPTLILIHGSALSSTSLHPLGKVLAAAGISVYAPDIRGHGMTGREGDMDYRGQLDDDLADIVAAVKAARPGAPLVLAGFSGPFMWRVLALLVLNRLGIHAFDHLPAIAFTIPPERADTFTGSYSFLLLRAITTTDYAADLKAIPSPIAVLVGEKDELFDAKRYAPTVQAVRPDAKVTVIPGINHIELTTDPRAVPLIVASIRGQG